MVYTTLKQLEDSLKTSPENFRIEDPVLGPLSGSFPVDPILTWQLKVKIKEDTYIQDPLNAARTIIVTYNKITKQLTCYIYFREVSSFNRAVMADSQVTFQCYKIPILNRSYRKFQKIRKQLIKQHREKEFLDYMKKLNSIFPATHEDELFR